MRQLKLLLATLWVFHLLAGPIANAADKERSVTGVVKDALGRPLEGVATALQSRNGRVMAHATTDKAGHFEFRGVSPGTYAVMATKAEFKQAIALVTVTAAGAKPVQISMAAQTALSLQLRAQKLNQARNDLSPETGSSVYRFTQQSIEQMPAGNNTPMTGVLLQAPGVVQDSFGQLHIRGEHAEIQYRINGIELPEGIAAGFSQTLSPRIASSISLLEGTLPAQYGYHTAGIVSIQTKTGEIKNGGNLGMYGGQRGTLNPSMEVGGTRGDLSYYATGYFLQNDRGLEPPTPGPEAINDTTQQGNGFGIANYFLTPTTRVSAFGGFNVAHYDIPANPGQKQVFMLAGTPVFPSADVDETQFEQNYFGVLALQGALHDDIDYQIAGFTRYSTLSFHPDDQGDLIFNGQSTRVFRSDWSSGLQGDFAYRGIAEHTIRAGSLFQGERAEFDNHSLTFPGTTGKQTSDIPIQIVDDGAETVWLYGIYLQDEWRPAEAPKLTVNYGARFDLYDGFTRSFQFSPRFTAAYQLFKPTTIHAGYARYFTPPPTENVAVTDIKAFKNTVAEPEVKADSNIAPERANYFDLGIVQNLPYGIRTDVDSYLKLSSQLIDEGQFGPTLIFTPFNYNSGRQYGVEVSNTWNRENLSAYVNFTYSVAQGSTITSDQFLFGKDELAYIGSHYVFLDHDQTFSSSEGIAYKLYGFLLTADGFYQSGLRRGFANTGNLPYYIQLNLGVARKMVLEGVGPVEARLVMQNANDRIYQIRNGTGIGVFASQYGPRRAVYAGIKWDLPWGNPAARN
ncbi:MAG TPA: TonB-dependent receptor [Candidatus Binataceae bacterium]|nr:TonB-dependent receptor [Candidatus Binataceae bacterium]